MYVYYLELENNLEKNVGNLVTNVLETKFPIQILHRLHLRLFRPRQIRRIL